MKSKISLILILVIILGCGSYLSITNLLDNRTGKFEKELTFTKSSLTVEQPREQSYYEVPTSTSAEQFIEIEVTSDEIRGADTKGNIGLTEPFNSDYITRVDVINSINRIGKEMISFEEMSSEYQTEFLTLRHVEMVEGVREKDSSLHIALKEYAETILPTERKQEGITQPLTQPSDSELLYQTDVSIAETESLLNGGNR